MLVLINNLFHLKSSSTEEKCLLWNEIIALISQLRRVLYLSIIWQCKILLMAYMRIAFGILNLRNSKPTPLLGYAVLKIHVWLCIFCIVIFRYTYHLVNAHLLYAKFGLRGILDYSLKNCINAKIIPLTRFYYKHFVHKKNGCAL